ncbi:hypothetical protein IT570_08170 [Candidatus Sumerlaeota bacterium]|nr:hypothetical protein [Candidatus Sumerlaeota bacterium]
MTEILQRRPWLSYAALSVLWIVVACLVIPTWGWTYWDFGDGNYLYVARRVREGLVLYKDILAPQPPLHIIAGMIAQSIGNLFHNELFGVRAYSLLSRFAASFVLFLIGMKLYENHVKAILCAAVYLFMPISFWWSMAYESENLEIVFLLLAMFLLVKWNRNSAMMAGICSALACHCNMTAVPYFIVNVIFLLFRMPRLAGWYAGAFVAFYGTTAVAANVWTEGYFADNVLFNQVGTFPRTDILRAANPDDSFLKYTFRKITSEGYKVLEIEGGLIAAAFIGMLSVLHRTPFQAKRPSTTDVGPSGDFSGSGHQTPNPCYLVEFLAWSTIGLMLSICFTAKGGTVNYIFCLGESGVALFAAEALALLWCGRGLRGASLRNTHPILTIIAATVVTFIIFAAPTQNIRLTLMKAQSELPVEVMNDVRSQIMTHTKPGDEILAPPFYAYATRTNVTGELAENYIWNIKYMNETFDGEQGPAVAKMREIATAIAAGKPRIILLDTAQTGRVPEIASAINQHYIPADPPQITTRNTRLTVWIPRK